MTIPIPVESAHNALASAVDMYAKALATYQQNVEQLQRAYGTASQQCADLTQQRDGLMKQLDAEREARGKLVKALDEERVSREKEASESRAIVEAFEPPPNAGV